MTNLSRLALHCRQVCCRQGIGVVLIARLRNATAIAETDVSLRRVRAYMCRAMFGGQDMARGFGRRHCLVGVVATELALLPFVANAQTPTVPVSAPVETADAAPIDPVRLAAARITIDHIFPVGTYARILGGSMDKLLSATMGSMGQIPLAEIAAVGGAPPQNIARMPKATIDDIMSILDPAFHERTALFMHVMLGEMNGLMSQVEPAIRDGMAHAYAGRFNLEQLNDMNRFFATPSGKAYAANAVLIQTDPAVMAKMQAFLPLMMKMLPDIRKKLDDASAMLPKPRKLADLTPAERSKLARLLGVDEAGFAKKAGAGGTTK